MNKRYEASYTVEMALLFPFLLFLIFTILYLGMSVHDSVKLGIYIENTLRLTQQALLHPYDYEKKEIIYDKIGGQENKVNLEEISSNLLELCKSKLWITDVKDIHLQAGVFKINIEARQKQRVSLLPVLFFLQPEWEKHTGSILKYQPENALRMKPN